MNTLRPIGSQVQVRYFNSSQKGVPAYIDVLYEVVAHEVMGDILREVFVIRRAQVGKTLPHWQPEPPERK